MVRDVLTRIGVPLTGRRTQAVLAAAISESSAVNTEPEGHEPSDGPESEPDSACISPGQIIHNSYGAIMFRSGLV